MYIYIDIKIFLQLHNYMKVQNLKHYKLNDSYHNQHSNQKYKPNSIAYWNNVLIQL